MLVGGFLIKIWVTTYRKFIMYQALCEMFWIHNYLNSSQPFDLYHICVINEETEAQRSQITLCQRSASEGCHSPSNMLFLLEFIQLIVWAQSMWWIPEEGQRGSGEKTATLWLFSLLSFLTVNRIQFNQIHSKKYISCSKL